MPRIFWKFLEHINREGTKKRKTLNGRLFMKNLISELLGEDFTNDFYKLPKKLQKKIVKIRDEEDTYWYDNQPGDNHD